MSKGKKVKPWKERNLSLVAFAVAFAAIGGIITLVATYAAVSNVIEDSSIAKPTNVQVFKDDRSLIVTWNDIKENPAGVVGWYIKYKKKGASSWENLRQTIHHSIQLQPLENGVEYEITVQAARGTYQEMAKGDVVYGDSSTIFWARADGHVSPPVTVTGTPSSARVDSMRSRLTGFFDDFNVPANPMDELKWNNASFGNEDNELNAMQFINNQFHVHNAINADFGGIVSRPRATFDASVGLNGGPISETNPAQVEFDMDIGVDGRSKWYLDFIPLSARYDKYPIDMDSHHSADDSQEHNEPGNTLRLDVNGAGYGATFTYWDKSRNFRQLFSWEDPSVCGNWSRDNNGVDFRATGGCPTSSKSLNPASPLPEMNSELLFTAQNVRRHWVMQFTPTKVKVFVDGAQIMQATLPADWAAEKQYTLQNTMFSYNTAKQFWTGINDNFSEGRAMGRRGVIPRFHFYHWDNFGFTGPAPSTVVHNYVESFDGTNPRYLNINGDNGPRDHTSIIVMPDDIGNLVGDKGKLFYTIKAQQSATYEWRQGDHILFNGKRYDMPNPETVMPNAPDYQNRGTDNATMVFNIAKADIKKGNNTIEWRAYGHDHSLVPINIHLELEYSKSGAIPNYTQPVDIYGQAFSNIVEPPMTNCDSYIYVEQDLGLPKLNGAANLEPAPCYFLSTLANHSGHSGTPTPVPAPDTQAPTVNLTAPANNTVLSGNTIKATASATDNVGVTQVAFAINGTVWATDSSAPYEANLDFTSFSPGTYAITAIAYDARNNHATTSAFNVIKQQPADTAKPTISSFSPANNYSVAASATTLKLSVNATDNVGVTRVDFYVDSAPVGNDTSASGGVFDYTFNPASLQAGTHKWKVDVRDAAGNVYSSAEWTFTTTAPTVPPDPDPDPTPPTIPDPVPTPNVPGDIDGDGHVGINDLLQVINNYSKNVPANTNGDLTGDGHVGIEDLRKVLVNYGK